jgi:ATP-binding cassette subfamily F protein uup
LLGRNGSGKTSFIRLLTGEIEPDGGKVKRSKHLQFSYFDQNREALNPKWSLRRNLCPGGGDYVDVMGKPRHVCGYLKDFLFDPKGADYLASTLSGGQKNRLMLAKVLARPTPFLILDEPTNDLDMDTLDMLEEILMRYDGTLLIVSHDRDFLDQTVTKILAFEGDGEIQGYIGGYSDYLAEKNGSVKPQNAAPKPAAKIVKEDPKPEAKAPKLSYKITYELEQLPKQIAELEGELEACRELLSDAGLYIRDPKAFDDASRKLQKKQAALEAAEMRWLELEALRESSTGS